MGCSCMRVPRAPPPPLTPSFWTRLGGLVLILTTVDAPLLLLPGSLQPPRSVGPVQCPLVRSSHVVWRCTPCGSLWDGAQAATVNSLLLCSASATEVEGRTDHASA